MLGIIQVPVFFFCQKMHIIISINGWIAPPDTDIVSHLLHKSHWQTKQKMVQIFVEISFSYQIFDFHAESVGQSGDRANGDVPGLDLAGFDFANLARVYSG